MNSAFVTAARSLSVYNIYAPLIAATINLESFIPVVNNFFFRIRILAGVSKVRRSRASLSCSACSPASPAMVTSWSRLRRRWRRWPRARPTTRMSSPRQTPCSPPSSPQSRQPRPSGGSSLRPPTSELGRDFLLFKLRLNDNDSPFKCMFIV